LSTNIRKGLDRVKTLVGIVVIVVVVVELDDEYEYGDDVAVVDAAAAATVVAMVGQYMQDNWLSGVWERGWGTILHKRVKTRQGILVLVGRIAFGCHIPLAFRPPVRTLELPLSHK
jgi:hypothetical protein